MISVIKKHNLSWPSKILKECLSVRLRVYVCLRLRTYLYACLTECTVVLHYTVQTFQHYVSCSVKPGI